MSAENNTSPADDAGVERVAACSAPETAKSGHCPEPTVVCALGEDAVSRFDDRRDEAFAEFAPCIVLRLDRQGVITFINDFGLRFFGYKREELIGRPVIGSITPPLDQNGRDMSAMLQALCDNPEALNQSENENMRKNGERVWVSWANRPLRRGDEFVGVISVGSDVTAGRRASEELARRERFYHSLIKNSSDLVTIVDRDGVILYESPAVTSCLGLSPEDTTGAALETHLHAEDVVGFRNMLAVVGEREDAAPVFEIRRKDRSGCDVHLEAVAANCLEDDAVSGIIINSRNITERKAFEEKIRRHAFHDALTGLPNRTLFMDRLTRAIARRRRGPEHSYAVLFVDIDRFKMVNDSLGHALGDKLLADIGKRLRSCLRKVDTVARFGGDEFVLLLDQVPDDREAFRVAERIKKALSRPFIVEKADGPTEVFASAGVGIVHGSPDYTDPDQVVRDADTAMHKAKSEGAGRCRVFHARMHSQAVEVLTLETDLRKSLQKDELELYYQPIIDIHSGRPMGMEALLRWNHPTRGLVSPLDFIPLAEETGLIIPIGDLVLERACRDIEQFNRAHPDSSPLFAAVNVSAKQFGRPDLAGKVASVLTDTGLPPHLLKIEITESAIMENPERAALILEELQELGAKPAIDDFGTGYSSLSHLHAFPFDTLKIDRSFINALDRDVKNGKIVQAIINLAENLDMTVVAEGIESEGQRSRLQGMGRFLGQGFLFARPMPMAALVEHMEQTYTKERPERTAAAVSNTRPEQVDGTGEHTA